MNMEMALLVPKLYSRNLIGIGKTILIINRSTLVAYTKNVYSVAELGSHLPLFPRNKHVFGSRNNLAFLQAKLYFFIKTQFRQNYP